jgi:hypothetical protein
LFPDQQFCQIPHAEYDKRLVLVHPFAQLRIVTTIAQEFGKRMAGLNRPLPAGKIAPRDNE